MAILDALGQHLEDVGIGTLGTSIFLSIMPDTPNVCVALYEDTGVGPVNLMGNNVVAIERPRIRAYVRAARNEYVAARTMAANVRDALGSLVATTIESVDIIAVEPTSDLYPITRDNDDRPIIACDFAGYVE